MTIKDPAAKYDRSDQAQFRREVEKLDRENWKRLQNIDLGQTDLILTDTTTGARYALRAVAGVVTLVAHP